MPKGIPWKTEEERKSAKKISNDRWRFSEKGEVWHESYYSSVHAIALKLWHNAKSHAEEKGVPFEITVDWVEERIPLGCALTGIPFVWGNGRDARSPSIDEIERGSGYTETNARVILDSLNRFKGTDTDDDMFYVARNLVANARLSPN